MYRDLPAVETLVVAVPSDLPHGQRVALARAVLNEARTAIRNGQAAPSTKDLLTRLAERALALQTPSLQPVINATGVILHTNLGRAPLSNLALQAIATVAAGYNNLEYDLERGERGSRAAHVTHLLARLTGAEAGIVVNNNAAAVMFMLSCLCTGREVIVSRGQAVEIGGGFRIPDVLAQSGARLVEVGTTNRTYARDYANACTPNTAAMLTVHRSNFHVIGFTHDPTDAELRSVASEHNILWLDDWGSGSLLQPADYGLPHEATVPDRVAAGCDVVCFSGDKLLGGPQAGLIVGRAAMIKQLQQHPLMRALRVDKLTLAAMEATLLSYLRGRATSEVPVWQMISQSAEAVAQRTQTLAAHLTTQGIANEIVACHSTIGGGSLPTETLPSWAIVLPTDPIAAATRLRTATPPIIGRIHENRLLLDLRTVLPEQETSLLRAIIESVNS